MRLADLVVQPEDHENTFYQNVTDGRTNFVVAKNNIFPEDPPFYYYKIDQSGFSMVSCSAFELACWLADKEPCDSPNN